MVPIGQVSPNCPLFPLLLLHPTIHPTSLLSLLPLFITTILYLSTPISFLFTSFLLHNCTLPYHVLPPLIFPFFCTIYRCPPLLPAPLPTFTHHIVLFSYTPHALHDPSHSPAPTSLSSPIFAFLTHLWALFYVHSHYIPCIYIHTCLLVLNIYILTAFFWMQPATRVGGMNI